jgi:hypothetical protein
MHHVTINQKNQKKERQKEGNLLPRKLSPKKCFQRNKKQKNSLSTSKRTGSKIIPKCLQKNRKQRIPHVRLTPSIHSRLVGSVGPMSPTTKKVLLCIGGSGAMATASAMRKLASRALPRWGSRSTRLGWVSIPSYRRDWGEGRSMRCRGRSGRHLRATRSVRLCQLGRSWRRKPPQC